MRQFLFLVIAFLALTACDSSTGPGSRDMVEVRFQSLPGTVAASPEGPSLLLGAQGMSEGGSNGTLELDGVWMIVAEFELKGTQTAVGEGCPGEEEEDDCHGFEAPPFFLELPLGDGSVSVATDEVPPGTYNGFEFEVEDLDDEDEEDGFGASELMGQIRASFPDWPEQASLLVTGTFTPTEGDPRPFRVFVDAEIEIEKRLDPPLVIADDGTAEFEAIVVHVDPLAWFRRSDGSVWDLSGYDFDQTGRLLELEAEMEHGFQHVDVDGDD